MLNEKLRQSIRLKFLIIVSTILLASTVIMSILISVNERAMFNHSLINKGNGLASYMAKLGKDPLIMKDSIELDIIVNQAINNEEVLYAVIQDASGNILTSQYASIDYRWPRIKEIVSVLPRDSKSKDIIARIRMQGGIIEVFTPILSDNDTIGKVTLGMSQHKINQQVVKTILFIVVLHLIVTLIIGALLLIVSKKLILDPITELVRVTKRFAKGDLTARVKTKTTGEVLVLTESFNLMMEDLGKAIISKENELAERKRVELKLQDTLERLRMAIGTTIQVMTSAVEIRDPYTAGHQTRSADLARAIATEMGLQLEKIDGIRMAGSIHDIGKLSIPAEILSKPTKLSEIEFSLIKEHSRKGYEMLKNVESSWPLAEIVYQHHERMDGSGYPRNLKGDEILMEARVLVVADVVESMASHRPYRPSLGIDAALEEIENNRGTYYDNTVVDACLRLFREKGYQLTQA